MSSEGNFTRSASATGCSVFSGTIGELSSRSPATLTDRNAVSGVLEPSAAVKNACSQMGAALSGAVERLSSTIRYSFCDRETSMLNGTGGGGGCGGGTGMTGKMGAAAAPVLVGFVGVGAGGRKGSPFTWRLNKLT